MKFQRWERLMNPTTTIDDLMVEAAVIVDRGTEAQVVPTLLRDELADAVARCEDPATTADACEMLAQLDRTIRAGRPTRTLPLAS